MENIVLYKVKLLIGGSSPQVPSCLHLLHVNDGEPPLQHGHQHPSAGLIIIHSYSSPSPKHQNLKQISNLDIDLQEHHNIFSKLNPDEYKQVCGLLASGLKILSFTNQFCSRVLKATISCDPGIIDFSFDILQGLVEDYSLIRFWAT